MSEGTSEWVSVPVDEWKRIEAVLKAAEEFERGYDIEHLARLIAAVRAYQEATR